MKYDVVIVGAGPAGLFTAYELITNNSKLKIAMTPNKSTLLFPILLFVQISET